MSRRRKDNRRAPQRVSEHTFSQQSLLIWAALALIALATCVAYAPALNGGQLWDDDAHITAPELQSAHGLYRIWFEPGATQQYYPLLHSAFWIEHALWGNSWLGYHLANLIEHLTAALLLFLILQRLHIPGALLATAIFALHPVMTESVAWMTEQKNTLSAVFYLAAFLVYLQFAEQRRLSQYICASLLFVLGLLTKTVIATLPAALLVVFWWQRDTLNWRRDVVPLLPWFALGLIAGLNTAWVERTQIGAQGVDFELTMLQRCLLTGRVIWFYLFKLLWPVNLIFIYPRWTIDPSIWWQWLFPIAALATTVLLWLLRKKSRASLAGWLFFVGTLFPVLGFLNVFPFLFSYVADHFQYLASLGIIVPLSAGLALAVQRLIQHSSRRPKQVLRVAGILAICLIALLGFLTWNQSHIYADAVTLYQTTTDKNPTCWMIYDNLGAVLIRTGHPQEAIEQLQHAIDLNPNFAEAFDSIGLAYTALNNLPKAIDYHRQAIQLVPNNARYHNNLGIVLGQLGRSQEAADEFQKALDLRPNFADARINLGSALVQLKQPQEALRQLELGLQLCPDSALAYMNSALALQQLDRSTEAISAANRALQLARSQHQFDLVERISRWLGAYESQQSSATPRANGASERNPK